MHVKYINVEEVKKLTQLELFCKLLLPFSVQIL